MPNEVLLSLARMARRVGLSKKFLKSAADEGRVPCLRDGHRYLFEPTATESALASLAAQSRQEVVGA